MLFGPRRLVGLTVFGRWWVRGGPGHGPTKQERGCEAGDKCLVPHHEVDKQPNKKA